MKSGWTGFWQRWIVTTIGVLIAANVVSGVSSDDIGSLLAASLLLGILNAFLRPVLMLISLPLLLLTLGLFTLVINATMLYLVGSIIKGFHVLDFWSAFKGAFVISIVSVIANVVAGKPKAKIEIKTSRSRPGPPPNPPIDTGSGPVIDV